MNQRYRTQQFTKLQVKVARLREEEGQTFAQIGRDLNLTRERIRQIYNDVVHWRKVWSMKGEKGEWARLPARLQTVLPNLGLKTKAQVARAIEKGELVYLVNHGCFYRDQHVRNLGLISWQELERWLKGELS